MLVIYFHIHVGYVGLILHSTAVATASWSTYAGTLKPEPEPEPMRYTDATMT